MVAGGFRDDYHPRPMRWMADFFYLLAGLLYLPVALYQRLRFGKHRGSWGERFGRVRHFPAARGRIWIHAVSLGEMNSTTRLVADLRARLPEWDIVFSTTTDTGYARAVVLYGPENVFRFPLDFSVVVSRVLRRVRPSLIVLMEQEVWFNLVHQAARRGIPVVVVNGRLTERSAGRLAWLRGVARSMFSRLTWVGAQDAVIAARFAALGVPPERIEVVPSLKWDTALESDSCGGAEALAEALGIDVEASVWVCGSTGNDEEPLLLEAYRKVLNNWSELTRGSDSGEKREVPSAPVLVLVPRKPERFDEVADLIARAGFGVIRRSERPDGTEGASVTNGAVILGDTMGELRKFYALADVVFVGRSLVPLGGSDPMEVAALGRAAVMGPHMENFAVPVSALSAANAIRQVDGPAELPFVVGRLLARPHLADQLGERALEIVRGHQGGTRRVADRLAAIAAECGSKVNA